MKKFSFLLIGALCLTSAFADEKMYAGATFSNVSLKDTSSDNLGTYSNKALSGNVGYVFHENIAVEGFWGTGLNKATNTVGTNTELELKLKDMYGVSLRPFLKLSQTSEVFLHLGTSHMSADATVRNTKTGASVARSNSEGRTFYGVGAAFKFNDDMSIVVDYKDWGTKDDTKISSFGVGFRYNFK